MTFKFNEDKDKALNQIKEKKYFEKYQGQGREIYLCGVEFTDRNVGDWVIEKRAVCSVDKGTIMMCICMAY